MVSIGTIGTDDKEMTRVPAIILGDRRSILRLGPKPMRYPARWTQRDSDVTAHFLQVHAQIVRSRWYQSEKRFSFQGGEVLDSSFPAFEDFVYAAVYIRQLFAKKDDLLNKSGRVYIEQVDCHATPSWVLHELGRFKQELKGDCFFPLGCSVQELFEAFMYGAGLLHVPQREKQKRFLGVYDKADRERLFYSLHTSLHELLLPVGNVAIAIGRDLGYWQQKYSLPLPDVRWHDRLFKTSSKKAQRA